MEDTIRVAMEYVVYSTGKKTIVATCKIRRSFSALGRGFQGSDRKKVFNLN